MIFPAPRQQHNRAPDMLFGRNHSRQQQSGPQSLLRPEAMSSLATKGADGLSRTLGNVQQVLKVIETTAPIVQQYGPMIKNLPALYRIMKAVNESDEGSAQTENEASEVPFQDKKESKEKTETSNQMGSKERRKRTGESRPILFI